MGQRANLIIVENGRYELYYDHWCANSLDSYLFWGVYETVSFIREHDKSGSEYWLDDVWCEGAVLVDLDNKKLLFFGGEDIMFNIPLRRVYLELLKEIWEGYEVNWAFEGIIDLARYVGYNWEKLLNRTEETNRDITDAFENEGDYYITGVFSLAHETEGLSIFPIYSYENNLLFCSDETVLTYISKLKSNLEVFKNGKYETDCFPNFGMHVDMKKRELIFWESDTTHADYYKKIENFWPGWEISYLYDNYHEHAELIKSDVVFPKTDHKKCIAQIKSIVCSENKNPVDMVDNLITALKNSGEKDIKVSSAVYDANYFNIPENSRDIIFETAVTKYLEKLRSEN